MNEYTTNHHNSAAHASNNHNNNNHNHVSNNTEYLAQLLKDKKQITAFPNIFMHLERLLEDEITKIRAILLSANVATRSEPLVLPEPEGPKVSLSGKVYVPIKDYPEFNFIGRILGPRGMTAKYLEQETGCKIMIRGKGSLRDKKKEEQNKGRPNWEHLDDELHVLITVEDTEERANLRMQKAKMEVARLLVPAAEGEDELKKMQLMELAILNGTFRDPNNKNQQLTNGQQQHQNIYATQNPNGGITILNGASSPSLPPGTAFINILGAGASPAGAPQTLVSYPTLAQHQHRIGSPSGGLSNTPGGYVLVSPPPPGYVFHQQHAALELNGGTTIPGGSSPHHHAAIHVIQQQQHHHQQITAHPVPAPLNYASQPSAEEDESCSHAMSRRSNIRNSQGVWGSVGSLLNHSINSSASSNCSIIQDTSANNNLSSSTRKIKTASPKESHGVMVNLSQGQLQQQQQHRTPPNAIHGHYQGNATTTYITPSPGPPHYIQQGGPPHNLGTPGNPTAAIISSPFPSAFTPLAFSPAPGTHLFDTNTGTFIVYDHHHQSLQHHSFVIPTSHLTAPGGGPAFEYPGPYEAATLAAFGSTKSRKIASHSNRAHPYHKPST